MARASLTVTPFIDSLAERLAASRSPGIILHWLGQAGFVVTTPRYRLVIDPYLSDSLARKYRGSATPHERIMAAPATPQELGPVDLVLCTHHHTDHMDGETLKPLAEAHPQLRFVVPRAALALSRERIGVDVERLVPLNAGERVEPLPGVVVRALRAAHETLEKDAEGHHRFLGYGIEMEGRCIFHSGDTIPFPRQTDDVAAIAPDLALLPANGRSERLRALEVAGNLTIAEAIGLAQACAIPAMIAHHCGMFAFNTADPREIDHAASRAALQVLRAELQMEYAFSPV
ncbi:MBL fold metallo-hydrolase [Taklimakanibacter lacteus]|uniref:MBL fold metallo-hydrolase n=1 Tax=Taklimakanibacter lacteus TaxID=2268456 RepID=UPI000E666178